MSKQTTVHGVLKDDVTGKTIKARVGFDCGKILVSIDGYGELMAKNGYGNPVIVDYYDGKVQVIIWSDINKEDPTASISLEGAKESNRNQE